MNFSKLGAIRGPPDTHAVHNVLEQIVAGDGCSTHQFPLQVLFELLGSAPAGSAVMNFQVGVHIGFATVIACHCFATMLIDEKIFEHLIGGSGKLLDGSLTASVTGGLDTLKELATLVLRVLRLHATFMPKATLAEQTMASIAEKNQAAARNRPTAIQLLFAFDRRVKELQGSGVRKTRSQLVAEFVRHFNGVQKQSAVKINADEAWSCSPACRPCESVTLVIVEVCALSAGTSQRKLHLLTFTACLQAAALKFLAARHDAVIREMKMAWSTQKPQYSAIPIALLGQLFLSDRGEPPVTAKENAV
jgi:hypothetical protein